jgi:hypothetical protein
MEIWMRGLLSPVAARVKARGGAENRHDPWLFMTGPALGSGDKPGFLFP